MTVIRHRHDKMFRKAMENLIVAKEFFDTHLPANIKPIIDFSTLKIEKETFIEKKLKNKASDVLYSVNFNNKPGYIHLLLEHQSTVDHFMALRLFKYMLEICDRHRTIYKDTKDLPVVYPMVFFNGTEPYTAPLSFWDLFSDKQLAKEFWTNKYQLINVHDIPDKEIKKRAWSGILQFFLKHGRERDLLKRWQEIADLLPEIVQMEIGYDYIETILYYTLTSINENDKIALEHLLDEHLDKEKGEKIMASLAKHWYEEGKEEGIERTAINMLKQKLDDKLICQVTGLSLEQLARLKNKL